jgi:outer membrane protein
MKNLFSKILAAMVLISVTGTSAWAQGRIVTINLQKVFEKYWKTKQAELELKSRADDMEKEHKNMLNDWTKAREDHQHLLSAANDQSASADDREKSKKAADAKLKYLKDTEESILQYEKQARTTLDEQKRRTIDKILVEIRTLVAEQAKSSGGAVVIDTSAESANHTPIVLFTANEEDMTDKVLATLNSTAPPENAKPEEAKSDTPPVKK